MLWLLQDQERSKENNNNNKSNMEEKIDRKGDYQKIKRFLAQ